MWGSEASSVKWESYMVTRLIQSEHTLHQSGVYVKGQEWCTSIHYTAILIKCKSLYSVARSVIECVRSAQDWWMLFSRCNNPQGAALNNDQHIWLMSAVSSLAVEVSAFVCLSYFVRRVMRDLHLQKWWWSILLGPNFFTESPHFVITHLRY